MRRRDFLKVPALAMILPYYSGLKLSQAKPIGCGIGIGRGDCKHCYHWTAEGLSRAMDSGFMFPGFSGETCHKCKRTANTLAGEAGWFCCCGEYNCQDLHYHQKPHKHPDLGPTSREIEKGFSQVPRADSRATRTPIPNEAMAKRKQRRKTNPSDALDPARKKRTAPKDRDLIEGDHIDSLPPPNQMLPAGVSGRDLFPLMGLKVEHEEGSRSAHAFVHPRYGEYYWAYWDNTPPSWMDPMLLVDMARKDTKVQALLVKALKANKKKPYLKALDQELLRVFEEEYLPWVVEKFDLARGLVADWLVINAAEQQLRGKEQEEKAAQVDKRRRKKRSRQKKKPTVE